MTAILGAQQKIQIFKMILDSLLDVLLVLVNFNKFIKKYFDYMYRNGIVLNNTK